MKIVRQKIARSLYPHHIRMGSGNINPVTPNLSQDLRWAA